MERCCDLSAVRRIVGNRTKRVFDRPRPEGAKDYVVTDSVGIEVFPADQTVTVGCGVTMTELQRRLAEHNQTLPLPDPQRHGTLVAGVPGTVGGFVAANLPHGLSASYGGPRQWLLHAEVEFLGQRAVSGAKVVKSVAGYDVHKVFVGSRGLLGPISKVTFRTWPVAAVRETTAVTLDEWDGGDVWILRTVRSEYRQCVDRALRLFAMDEESCTLWLGSRPEAPLEGWIIGPGGEMWQDVSNKALQDRLKQVFDSEGKWI